MQHEMRIGMAKYWVTVEPSPLGRMVHAHISVRDLDVWVNAPTVERALVAIRGAAVAILEADDKAKGGF